MTLDQLKRVLDDQFGEPHLAKHHVRASWVQCDTPGLKTLRLQVGRRVVWLTDLPGGIRCQTRQPVKPGQAIERDTSGEAA